MLFEQCEGLFVRERSMFDRIDPQPQRVVDRFLPLCVRRHLHAERVGRVDGCFDLLVAHQLQMRIVAGAQHPSARHDLDQVRPALVVIAHRLHHLHGARDYRMCEPQRIEREIRVQCVGRVAMSAHRAQRFQRYPHARSRDHARIDCVLERQVNAVRSAHAAHGGEALLQNLPGRNGGRQHRIEVSARAALDRDRPTTARTPLSRTHVLMGIDQARQHGGFREVDYLSPGWPHESRLHLRDLLVVDDDGNL